MKGVPPVHGIAVSMNGGSLTIRTRSASLTFLKLSDSSRPRLL